MAKTLKNKHHKKEWFRSLQMHAFPVFGSKTADAIELDDILKAIGPLGREAALLKIEDDTSPAKLVDILRNSVTQPEMPESGEFVRVMSLHKSKGLTSRVVIIAGCVEGLIPTIGQDKSPDEKASDLKEQRRLFYVGITGGKEILAISSVTQLPRDLAYKIGARLSSMGAQSQPASSRSQVQEHLLRRQARRGWQMNSAESEWLLDDSNLIWSQVHLLPQYWGVMPRDFFDPTPEQQNVTLIDAATLSKAEPLIESCEACNEERSQIPFDNILDRVIGSDPSATDYILEEPAKCPSCRATDFRKDSS